PSAMWPTACVGSSRSRCVVVSSRVPGRAAFAGLSVVALALCGCSATRPIDLPLPKDARVVDVIGDYVPFQKSPKNRYAVVLRGQEFTPPSRPFRIASAEDVRREGTPVPDSFTESDVDQVTRLLVSKDFDVYKVDMGEATASDVQKLL